MRFRKLRIAGSVVFGIACVLLIALWVRSIKHSDTFTVEIFGVRGFEVWSNLQQFGLFTYPLENASRLPLSLYVSTGTDLCHPADNTNGFKVSCEAGYAALVAPHWLFAILTAIPPLRIWLRKPGQFSFSLRTLLVATTLVAVILGLTVVVARWPPAGKANAINVARQWMRDQGEDPSTSRFSADADGPDWQVFIEYQPPTPGAHTFLRIDPEGNVTEVVHGL